MKKTYWKEALELLRKGEFFSQEQIDFRNELISVRDVIFFNKNNIRVPEKLIFYDDENIDCSDIPEISDNDILEGRIQWIKSEEFPLDNEIRAWIVNQKIKLNELIPQLIKNFYQTVKSIQNKAAI